MKSNIIHLIWLTQTVCAVLLYYNFFTNTTVTCNSRNSKLTKTPITFIRYIYMSLSKNGKFPVHDLTTVGFILFLIFHSNLCFL